MAGSGSGMLAFCGSILDAAWGGRQCWASSLVGIATSNPMLPSPPLAWRLLHHITCDPGTSLFLLRLTSHRWETPRYTLGRGTGLTSLLQGPGSYTCFSTGWQPHLTLPLYSPFFLSVRASCPSDQSRLLGPQWLRQGCEYRPLTWEVIPGAPAVG